MKSIWKKIGIIVLIVTIVVAVFDVAVLICNEVWSRKHAQVSIQAKQAGYPETYDICTRHENVVVDGREYLHFSAHRDAMLDGDYYEEFVVPVEEQFTDLCPEQNANLEIFAKQIKYVKDADGENYTLIEVYLIDDYKRRYIDALFEWGFMATFVVAPVAVVSGAVWMVCRYRRG